MRNSIESHLPIGNPSQNDSRIKLKETCIAFESIFITYMLKSQETFNSDSSFFGNNKIMQSMFSENLARGIADGGGMGLGDVLFDRLTHT